LKRSKEKINRYLSIPRGFGCNYPHKPEQSPELISCETLLLWRNGSSSGPQPEGAIGQLPLSKISTNVCICCVYVFVRYVYVFVRYVYV